MGSLAKQKLRSIGSLFDLNTEAEIADHLITSDHATFASKTSKIFRVLWKTKKPVEKCPQKGHNERVRVVSALCKPI